MVLSTVHANSAAESITRLLSFGLKGFEVTSVLSSVIAQRLVRKISADAEIVWEKPSDIEREWLVKKKDSMRISGCRATSAVRFIRADPFG